MNNGAEKSSVAHTFTVSKWISGDLQEGMNNPAKKTPGSDEVK